MSSRSRRSKAKAKRAVAKPPTSEELDGIVGHWKVDCVSFSKTQDPTQHTFPDYAGVEVSLDDGCDITWTLPSTVEMDPLFCTTNFSIDKKTLELFGGQDGKKFSFDVEEKEGGALLLETDVLALDDDGEDDDEMSGVMILTLVKAPRPLEDQLEGFTMQGALDEAYFSDLTVTSSDGTGFKVHRAILSHTLPSMTSSDWQVLVAALKSHHVRIILSYAYTHRLPTSLSLATAREVMAVISPHPRLGHMTQLCSTFIGSHDLKQRLMGLVDDLQTSLQLAKGMIDSTDVTNPVKITYSLKQLVKEATVGAAKFGLLCELYSRNKREMSKPEKQEVLEYVRARVVVFIDLLCELIDSALSKYTSLTEAQRLETATYIIPEVEKVWDLINMTCGDVKAAMAFRLSSLSKKKVPKRPVLKLSLLLQLITKGKEAKRLYAIRKEFDDFLQTSTSKREGFKNMNEGDRVAKIMRAIEGLEKEGTAQRTQLQAAKTHILMDNALDWKKFKVLTSLCCTYVSWGVRRAQYLKEPMLPSILKACKFVGRPELNEILVYLDLLTESDVRSLQADEDDEGAWHVAMPPSLSSRGASDNLLAQGCYKLLGSDLLTDMEFVLIPEGGVVSGEGGVVIRAHRVIVASRCEWMKRALLSGMREAIDKRIVVRDCSESTFRTFLRYLYGGWAGLETTPTEEVVDLLAAADQYETSVLRGRCEGCLVERVEDVNVFPLLQVADRYSVKRLREASLQYILNDSDVIMREVDGYCDLADDLKQELRSLLSSATDPHLLLHHQGATSRTTKTSSSSDSSDDIIPVQGYDGTTPLTLDEDYQDPDTLEFQASLEEVKAIVGSDASEEVLKELLMQADMDVNRAINFYYNID